MRLPKINPVSFGPKWIGLSLLTALALPGIFWLITGEFNLIYCIPGGIMLPAFLIVFILEMRQDSGKTVYYEKHLSEDIPFDPASQYAVIKCSICTGERVAGFKSRAGGEFIEVMLIKSDADLKKFTDIYCIDEIKKEY